MQFTLANSKEIWYNIGYRKASNSAMISREITDLIRKRATEFPVVTITGPRQSGKTTIVKACFPDYDYVNLEDPETREIAQEDYKRFFAMHKAPLIIDEIQRVPKLASVIQTLVDEKRNVHGQFILTGSHQPLLKETVTQSLAGRSAFLKLLPLTISELAHSGSDKLTQDALILRGGMPELAISDVEASVYYKNYLQTYIERDVRTIANIKNASAFNRFITLLAGRVGQLVNLNTLSGEVGVSHTTLAQWLDILEASFIVFRLYPYYANIGKRLIKTPKIYFTETGLAACLLGLKTEEQVSRDPLRGSLFENLIVSDILKKNLNQDVEGELFFFRTNDGLEVDLLSRTDRGLQPIEIKAATTWSSTLASSLHKYLKLMPNAINPLLIYGGRSMPATDAIAISNYLD